MTQKRRSPRVAGNVAQAGGLRAWEVYRTADGPKLPHNWRQRLPTPAEYFSARVERLGKPNASGWAQGRCPLHDDRNESLSVNIAGERGGWRCFAGCGAGDMVSFHERLTGKAFKDAVVDLLGVRA